MNQRDRLLDQIRRIALRGLGERQTDGQLLEHFISERDEMSFALLLRRHGAMVWSVCRRVLGNPHDADDAFQAAFLVLVRKADSIRPREAVGNWLYGVAYRTALEARGRIARRRAKEHSLQDLPPLASKLDEQEQDLWPILDRELSRLADKYRLPIVLCDLEGRSRKEVAQQLAIPEGTLSSRLTTARKKLAVRLARYGFTISAATLGTLLAEKTAKASLSLSLISSTTKAALLVAAGPAVAAGIVSATVSSLTEGVLKAMFIAKIKTATLLLCGVAAFGVGTGGVYYQSRAGAADSTQVERVAQDNRNNFSEQQDRELDKLKRENQRLRDMLEKERDQKEAFREKFNNFENNIRKSVQSGLAARSDESDQKPDRNSALEKKQAARDQLKMEFDKQFEDLQAKLQHLNEQQKKLQAQREQLEAQLKALLAQRKQLERDQKKLKESFQRRVENLVDKKTKTPQEPSENQTKKLPPLPVQKPAGGDKLDQILQRLERMEKRLDRMERNRE